MPLRKQSVYEDGDIVLQLPDGWKRSRRSSEELLIFSNRSSGRQLTVSVAVMREQDPPAELVLEGSKRMYDIRLQAERDVGGAEDLWQSDEVADMGGTMLGVFSGADPRGRMFMGMVQSSGRRIVMAYFEGYSGTPQEHLRAAGAMLQGLVIK